MNCLFSLFKNYLIGDGIGKDNIIAIELDSDINKEYRDPYKLSEYIRGRCCDESKKYYVLLDEIQFAISKDE